MRSIFFPSPVPPPLGPASPASTVGAMLATDLASGRTAEGVERSYIHFRPIPADVRHQLVEEGEVFYCAGGLMVEHPLLEPHIERLEGSQCSIMGLGKQLLMRLLLQAAGV
ncbi:Maf-like protein [Tetrabaena socialis]|uniref:Maf-like protein n=1 Tax=Tetrabaena socialis TaxID=47790 RepID=A0A2J7ZQ56_9CHLO|nr:Maf-like protein [Tetrabaena socialis]|eukprot:PNH02386.1 Maf-like protein [Tetrabaena socialis]